MIRTFKCVVVPHGKMVVVEISTRPAKAGKGAK